MSTDKQTILRKSIGIFYEENKQKGKSYTLKHFVAEKVAKSTIYDTMARVDNGISLERKVGSGQHRAIPQKKKDKIIEFSVNKVGLSYNSIGKKFKVSHSSAKNILLKAGVVKKRRIKAPKSDENQQIRQKKRLEKLRRGLLKPSNNIEIIMDDESYFTLDGSDFYGNDFYHSFEYLEPEP